MNWERLFHSNRSLRALTGLSIDQFNDLSERMEVLYVQSLRKGKEYKRQPGGGRKPKEFYTGKSKLFMVLFYLKVYPTFDLMAVFFDLDKSRCHHWVKVLLPILEALLGEKQCLPKRKIKTAEEFYQSFPEVKEVLIDGTERQIQKPSSPSRNRKHYSGKKKQHTRKTLVVTDEAKRILILTPTRRGKRHDKKQLDKEQLVAQIPPDIGLLGDTGFQGVNHSRLHIPFKRTKNHPLDEEQKQWNQLLSSVRIKVEHAIGGMKRYGAFSKIYRNHLPNLDDTFHLLSAGLWNFHLQS